MGGDSAQPNARVQIRQMKITYFADFSKGNKLKREFDIKIALEKLGHKVLAIDETDFDVKKLIEEANKSDLFLFHHGGILHTNFLDFQLSLMRIETILKNIRCKKVFWFFDKVIGMGENLMEGIIPIVDYGFLNDETWIRRHKYTNIFPMHLAYGEGVIPSGKYKKEYEHDIVFLGNVYDTRIPFIESMKSDFGDKFKIYNDKFGRDFVDMCESSKIIVSPRSPFDDFYWSDRLYRTLIARGFIIHPKLEGLKTEFRGKNVFETYNSWDELSDKIKYWLQPELHDKMRDIAQKGRNFVYEKFSYSNRLREILEIIK